MSLKLIINTDGGARGNPGPAGIGVVIIGAHAELLGQHKEYIGEATNNIAEYRALILGLEQAAAFGATEIQINMDSELIVRQMQGVYKIKEPSLKILASKALKLMNKFRVVKFFHVKRELNKQADKLVNEAIDEGLSSTFLKSRSSPAGGAV